MTGKTSYRVIVAAMCSAAAIAFLCDWRAGAAMSLPLLLAAFMLRQEIIRSGRARREVIGANAQLHQRLDELQQRSRELTMLTEMSELLQLSTTLEEASEILPSFAEHLFPSFDGGLYVAAAPGRLELAAWWGDRPGESGFQAGECWALRRAHAHRSEPGTAGVTCGHHAHGAAGPHLCVPMLASGEAIGVLGLCSRDRSPIAPDTELFAKAFGDQIALALANLRLQETLRTRAVRDPLTGLFNRGYLHEALTHELRRSSRPGIVLADVDHFKRYNDTWGHPAGDVLLQQLARVMQRVFREQDVVCRYGGEEFAIILPGATPDLLRLSAERLRDETRALHAAIDQQASGPITLSAGIALAPRDGMTVDELLAAADRALYSAKRAGRDRVANPMPSVHGLDAA